MEWSPSLDRANSVTGIRNWWQSDQRSVRHGHRSLRLGATADACCGCWRASPPKMKGWRVLWRRIRKGRCRIFNFSKSVCVAYDPYTYAQNFDHGFASLEPDNLSRSFSARFSSRSRDYLVRIDRDFA
ncbi:uncharacterized protein LOC116246140 [Nymphaea colorata]|nr:uncharacterized protein LOC116246140 [Nymphaea colorata]